MTFTHPKHQIIIWLFRAAAILQYKVEVIEDNKP